MRERSSWRRGRLGGSEIAAGSAGAAAPGLISATACDAGAHWISARRWRSSRPGRRGCAVAVTAWSSARSRGHATTRGSPGPENLTDRQQAKLSSIQKTNARLYRAYLLKEQLRQIYRLPAAQAIRLLDEWIAWARRCRLPAFVKLAKTITAQRAGIVAAIEHGLSNARVEAINTQIRMITRRAYGFHSPDALIALAMLALANLCPPLPR